MIKSNELILPLTIALLLLLIPAWMMSKYLNEFSFYQRLNSTGINATARLDNKYIVIRDSWLSNYFLPDSEDTYKFKAGYRLSDDVWTQCEFGVTRDTYYSVSIRDQLMIVYDPKNPHKCALPEGIQVTRLILLVSVIFAVFLILLGIYFLYYIYKSFRALKPGEHIELTTYIDIGNEKPACPRCNKTMAEGYMPTVGGVSWRDNNQPIGIPTILNGLPGTTFWVKRPLLHAFRCRDCEIIIFKYGGK